MQRLLITGGSGYLGRELVRLALASRIWHVAATYYSQPLAELRVHAVPLDVRDCAAVQQTITAFRPDVVIHTAYVQRGPDLWDATARGAGHVAQAARALESRLIHLSSDVIFDGERDGPYTEQDTPNPISPYGAAKAEAEHLVVQAHPDALLVRTSLIYGGHVPGVHEQFVLNALDNDRDVAFYEDELRCPVQVTDLALALLELAAMDRAGVLNVAGPDVVSRYAFAQLIANAYGRNVASVRAGLSAESGVPRPRRCALDSTLAQRLLHTRLRGVHEVLAPASMPVAPSR